MPSVCYFSLEGERSEGATLMGCGGYIVCFYSPLSNCSMRCSSSYIHAVVQQERA